MALNGMRQQLESLSPEDTKEALEILMERTFPFNVIKENILRNDRAGLRTTRNTVGGDVANHMTMYARPHMVGGQYSGMVELSLEESLLRADQMLVLGEWALKIACGQAGVPQDAVDKALAELRPLLAAKPQDL